MIKSANSNEAAICCNVGYSVSDPSKVRELASVDFKSGPLNTDYDCFLYSGPGTFQLEGDGGFINVSISFYGTLRAHWLIMLAADCHPEWTLQLRFWHSHLPIGDRRRD